MIDQNSISTISDLRFKTKEVFKKALKKPVFLFARSVPKGVLLSIEEYQSLMDSLEDYYDSLRAEELAKEDKLKVKWISHEELIKELNV